MVEGLARLYCPPAVLQPDYANAGNVAGGSIDVYLSFEIVNKINKIAKAAPWIGFGVDMTVQLIEGENVNDAFIKAGVHTLVQVGAQAGVAYLGAKIGGTVGAIFGGPVGVVIGAGAGMAVGFIFDEIYDNWDSIWNEIKSTTNNVMNQLSEFANDVEDWIGNIF